MNANCKKEESKAKKENSKEKANFGKATIKTNFYPVCHDGARPSCKVP